MLKLQNFKMERKKNKSNTHSSLNLKKLTLPHCRSSPSQSAKYSLKLESLKRRIKTMGLLIAPQFLRLNLTTYMKKEVSQLSKTASKFQLKFPRSR